LTEVIRDAQFRDLIVSCARSLVGTPFQHQASLRGQGADCLGVIRAVWKDCYGYEASPKLTYSEGWSVGRRDDLLLTALDQYLHRVALDFEQSGDVLVFKLGAKNVAKHLAIGVGAVGGVPTMVHSVSSVGVVESPISDVWMRRCIAQFQFPRGA